MKEDRLYIMLRIILGIIFIWASWEKIIDPGGFARVVKNYAILPEILINPVALFLPWVEAICGILLITGYLVKGSAFIVDTLMCVFILAFVINMFRGIDISCGCFSNTLKPATKMEYFYDILRDFAILGVGIWILFYKIRMNQLKAREIILHGGDSGEHRL